MRAKYLTKATEIAKGLLRHVVVQGDIVIDGTMGNGNDTLFLADLVGKEGKVFAFDIQTTALENTKMLLKQHGVLERVVLIQDCHGNMDHYVTDPVKAIMFNLGYLPKGDHRVVTRPETTLLAIEKSLSLLQAHGIITLAIYYGHEEGEDEKERVLSYLASIDQSKYNVLRMDFINQRNNPPLLLAIEKK